MDRRPKCRMKRTIRLDESSEDDADPGFNETQTHRACIRRVSEGEPILVCRWFQVSEGSGNLEPGNQYFDIDLFNLITRSLGGDHDETSLAETCCPEAPHDHPVEP